jgi:outer membrane protein assembly factor BamE (lipoprotein component of BamABCDE complex)
MRAAILSAALFLSACANQTSTLVNRAGQLTPAVSTRDEVIALMGRPTSESAVPGGGVLMQWMENQQPKPAGDKAADVAVLFDSRGRVVRITHR